MGDLTKNLSRREYSCRCQCGFNTVDFELVKITQECADHFAAKDNIDVRIEITGPNRCKEHNETVQKQYNPDYVAYSSKTQHMYGRAADFKLFNRHTGDQIDPERVADYLDKRFPDKFGIGRYKNRTHFDTRSGIKARWRG